jgi:huntingtin interacting protein 1
MASLSLPRVLHPRKTSLEIERENFEKSQTQALSKAINSQETPVKQKHVRSAIIGTFHTQGATTFWSIALRLPAMDDRIVAWKLCHVVHKILREGHPLCLVHSQRHKKDLDEIGKLWVHLREGYGKMIRLYTSLLMTKLDFHRKNPRFPGHLGVTPEELESIGGNDINNYFQMTVEMFDYLDNIIDLQAAVFGSLDMARSNSMTSAGQCRLAPLIPCIQDASKLYDYCVKILFKLHYSLPSDILSGHRDRFLKQFKLLKQFYQNTSNLQYFKDLIAIPPLPENPPNFLIQSDLRTYVTQEVVVPQEIEEEHPAEASLIDTSDVADTIDSHSSNSASPSPAHQEVIAERDFLRSQCEKLRYLDNTVVGRR